jgi:hypothetical protein
MRLMDNASLGRCVPWMMRPFDDASLMMSLGITYSTEAGLWDENQTKVLRTVLLTIHSFALRFVFLQTYVKLLYTVKEKGGKPDQKPYPLSYGLRNPYRNPKSENFLYYAQKPQRNCKFMISASYDEYSHLLIAETWVTQRTFLRGHNTSSPF